MSLQGPVVVVADQSASDLVGAITAAGAFPVVEASRADAAAAIGKIEPAAVVLADPDISPLGRKITDALGKVATRSHGLYLPVLARMAPGAKPVIPDALPIAADASVDRIVARLGCALRVRTLDATRRRRAETLAAQGTEVPELADTDPLDDATVLVLGRGRSYPELSIAVGERLGLIGALSVETAARYLNARDVDGVLVSDGFGPRIVDAFLQVLAENARFRDLPVAVLAGTAGAIDHGTLPNMEMVAGTPADVVTRMLPLVRQHAYAGRLQRLLAAIEAKGMIDAETSLFTVAAFLRDLRRAVSEAAEYGSGLSIARFSFAAPIDRRTSFDAARLVSRLVRSIDFACRAVDGSILVVFSATSLRSAHVVARRIGSVLKHTMLSSATKDRRIDPLITLATLKASDTIESLLARVNETSAVAAE